MKMGMNMEMNLKQEQVVPEISAQDMPAFVEKILKMTKGTEGGMVVEDIQKALKMKGEIQEYLENNDMKEEVNMSMAEKDGSDTAICKLFIK
ncbi:MAG: hypothetical protein ACI9AR_000134 [Flavobacteriaceae bacterium]|jgi:hypothetical protein